MKKKLFDRYILVLPAWTCEQKDSYAFINEKDKDIFVFTNYHEVITANLMKENSNIKKRKNTCFIIDDASGQQMFNLDNSLIQLITIIRHLDVCLWLLCHAASGIMGVFLRSNVDILLISRITNRKLLETLHEEYLSLTSSYQGREGFKRFISDVVNLHKEPFQSIYVDLRENLLDMGVNGWKF
jgi:hypothetical protein